MPKVFIQFKQPESDYSKLAHFIMKKELDDPMRIEIKANDKATNTIVDALNSKGYETHIFLIP